MRPLLLVLVAAAACASTGEGGPRREPNRISLAEIQASSFTNAYEIVQGLRPRWLRPVAGSSLRGGSDPVRVYMDGARSQGLQSIPRLVIQEIRYYTPTEAQARWGLSHQGGAINVITRKDGGG